MKTLVVIGHPDVATSSTQGFFKHAAKQEAGVTWYPLVAPLTVGRSGPCFGLPTGSSLNFPSIGTASRR